MKIKEIISSLLKVTATVIAGFFTGLMIGVALGLLVGLVMGLFYQELVYSGQPLLWSVIAGLLLAGLMGALATQILNKIFETEHNLLGGALRGAVVGIGVIVFYGIINTPDPEALNQEWYFVPLGYCISIGAQIGSIIFPLFGAGAVIRDMYAEATFSRKAKEQALERRNELSFYKSKSDVDKNK